MNWHPSRRRQRSSQLKSRSPLSAGFTLSPFLSTPNGVTIDDLYAEYLGWFANKAGYF